MRLEAAMIAKGVRLPAGVSLGLVCRVPGKTCRWSGSVTTGESPEVAYTDRVPPSLSIIMPVLDEEEEIARILTGARPSLDRARTASWEIIVVDNASTDRTCELVRALRRRDRRIRLLRNEVNRGKGFSIRRGMLEANGDMRLMCDADCVTSLNSLARPARKGPRGGRRGRRVATQFGGRRLTAATHSSANRRIRLPGSHPHRHGTAAPRRVLRIQALAWGRGRYRLRRSCTSTAGPSTPRRWRWPAGSGTASGEVGIEWTNRADSRLSIGNVLIPVTGELLAARRNVRRAAAGPGRSVRALSLADGRADAGHDRRSP